MSSSKSRTYNSSNITVTAVVIAAAGGLVLAIVIIIVVVITPVVIALVIVIRNGKIWLAMFGVIHVALLKTIGYLLIQIL